MSFHITPYADQNITQDVANQRLPMDKMVVGWYSNRQVLQSVVHSHPYHEFIYMVSGKALYHTNGSQYRLHPGEMMLIPPGNVHAGFYDTYDRLILQIDDTFWREALNHAGLSLLPQSELDVLILPEEPIFKWDIRGLIEQSAAAATISDIHLRDLMYRCQLIELKLMLDQMIGECTLGVPTSTNALVAEVTGYIQQHYHDPDLSVTMLAQMNYVSREHLSRVFKEQTMQSIHSYLTDLRMQSCRRAIADGWNILEACTENGFSNYSSFLKTFRKLYGMSPTEYRTQLRRVMQN